MKRSLPLMAIVSIIFFNVSGGAYALEEVLAVGPGLAIALLLITPLIWSAPVALVCAELGAAIPEEGGYYAWSKRALGPFGSFCQGWWAWLYTFVDIGLYPTMFCDYLAYFVPEVGEDGNFWLRRGVMLVMIWSFVLLNLCGSATLGKLAKGATLLVLSPFVLLVLIGLWRGCTSGFAHSPVTPFVSGGTSIGSALAVAIPLVLWNFMGWDSISPIAGEMQNPQRDYPRALLIAAVLIATCYAVPALLAMALLGPNDMTWAAGAWSTAAEKIAGHWLGAFLSAMGMLSAIGLYSALVLVYSRVPFVMGRDGYLPKALMKTNQTFDCAIADYTVAPLYINMEQKGKIQFAIEFSKSPSDISAYQKLLDENLQQENSNYKQKRANNLALDSLEVIALREGTFYKWLSSKNKLGGQNKVPRLVNGRSVIEEIYKTL